MEKAKVWVINSKNFKFKPRFRYSVIEFEQKYYLIDNDRACWGYISPIFTWKIPETVMKINLSKEEVNALLLDKEGQKKVDEVGTSVAGTGVFISVVLGPALLFPIIEHFFNFHFPIFVNVLITFTIIIGMLVLKSRLSKSAHQLIDIIGKENLSEVEMWIFPASGGQKIKILAYSMVISLMAWSLFIFLSTEENEMNFIILLMGVMGLLAVLHRSTVLRMLAEYRVKILDQQEFKK